MKPGREREMQLEDSPERLIFWQAKRAADALTIISSTLLRISDLLAEHNEIMEKTVVVLEDLESAQ